MAARKNIVAAPAILMVGHSGRGRAKGTTTGPSDKSIARTEALDALVTMPQVQVQRPGKDAPSYSGWVLPNDFVSECKSSLISVIAKWAKDRGHTRSLHTENLDDGSKVFVLELK